LARILLYKHIGNTSESKNAHFQEVGIIGNIVRKIVVCLVGAFIYATGVCVLTRSALGISPISSVPYVASLLSGWTLGTYTMLLNVVLILVQKLMLKKGFTVRDIAMQIGISIVFSFFIDLNIFFFGWYFPQTYSEKMAYLLFGCVVLAVGMSLVVMANLVVLPGEGVVKCVVKYVHCEFGTAKVAFDCCMVACAAVLSLTFSHRVEGIREGTLISAILIGTFSKFIMRRYKDRIDRFLI
jgi:uncharacterized membrane protein YczE